MDWLLYRLLPYLALALGLGGLGWRIWLWRRSPNPLKVPLLPGPRRLAGVGLRLGRQLLASPSLWRGDRALWAGAGLFHLCLLLVGLGHLRLILSPVPDWVVWLRGPAGLAGGLLPLAILFLLLRRLANPRLLLISARSDFLLLLLLLALAASGLWLKYGPRPPLDEVKLYLLGLTGLAPAPAPLGLAFALHFAMALVLLALFPFSKLMHALAMFFNPVWTQRDNAIARRHLNPWDRQYEGDDLGSPDLAAGERPFFTDLRYRDYLKFRWSAVGVHRVMGANERASTLPGQGDGHDR